MLLLNFTIKLIIIFFVPFMWSLITEISTPTSESEFQCQFWSIPIQFKCDGIKHCIPDGADEKDCPQAPAISPPTSIPSIKAPTDHMELRVEFQKDKKTAWTSKKDIREMLSTISYNWIYFFLDCGKSKSKREEESARQVIGTDADINKVRVILRRLKELGISMWLILICC